MDTQTIKSQEKSTKTTERISGSEAIVRCLIEEGVDILYGYPSEDTLQSWFKKDVELGGCIVGNEKPTHKCFKCGHQW